MYFIKKNATFWDYCIIKREFKTKNLLIEKKEKLLNEISKLEEEILNKEKTKKEIKAYIDRDPMCKFDPVIRKNELKIATYFYKADIKKEKKEKEILCQNVKKKQFEIKAIEFKLTKRTYYEKKAKERFFKDHNYKREKRKEQKIDAELEKFAEKERRAQMYAELFGKKE